MKFMFPVPQNWQLIKSPTKVQMMPEKQDAAILFSLDPSGTRSLEMIGDTQAGCQYPKSTLVGI